MQSNFNRYYETKLHNYINKIIPVLNPPPPQESNFLREIKIEEKEKKKRLRTASIITIAKKKVENYSNTTTVQFRP